MANLVSPASQNLGRQALTVLSNLIGEKNVFKICIAAAVALVFTLASATGFVANHEDVNPPGSVNPYLKNLFKKLAIGGGVVTAGLLGRAIQLVATPKH